MFKGTDENRRESSPSASSFFPLACQAHPTLDVVGVDWCGLVWPEDGDGRIREPLGGGMDLSKAETGDARKGGTCL